MLVSMNACYAYTPVTTTALPEAATVSVTLTLPGTVALQSTLGQGVNELDGTVIRSTSDSLVVAVDKMYTLQKQSFASSGTTAAIPRAYIDEVKVRSFSRKRTTLTIIGGLVAAIVAAAVVSGSASGDPGGGTTTPP
jgi:hypothetical protein